MPSAPFSRQLKGFLLPHQHYVDRPLLEIWLPQGPSNRLVLRQNHLNHIVGSLPALRLPLLVRHSSTCWAYRPSVHEVCAQCYWSLGILRAPPVVLLDLGWKRLVSSSGLTALTRSSIYLVGASSYAALVDA